MKYIYIILVRLKHIFDPLTFKKLRFWPLTKKYQCCPLFLGKYTTEISSFDPLCLQKYVLLALFLYTKRCGFDLLCLGHDVFSATLQCLVNIGRGWGGKIIILLLGGQNRNILKVKESKYNL